MRQGREFKTVGLSIPEELYRQVLDVAADRLRRGEGGGFSAALRELARAELARRDRRRKPSPEASA